MKELDTVTVVLTPAERRGASGREMLEQFGRCPRPMPVPDRHTLPFD